METEQGSTQFLEHILYPPPPPLHGEISSTMINTFVTLSAKPAFLCENRIVGINEERLKISKEHVRLFLQAAVIFSFAVC